MFKRFNRPSERAIGDPTLLETTLDKRSVEGLTNLSNGDFSLSSRPAFGRKQAEDVIKDLPDLPFKSDQTLQPPSNSTRPYSTGSSVYSQPSPDRRNKQPRLSIPRASSVYPDDVSPPDSPRTADGARSRKSSPNISPITDAGSNSHKFPPNRPYMSSIPLPRAQQNTGGLASVSGWREKVGRVVTPAEDTKLTRWDDFSGEPTDSETGKPAQAVPGSTGFEQQSSIGAGSGGHSVPPKVGAGPNETSKLSFSERLRRAAKTEETPVVREDWKGASGRSTMVKPVADNPRPPGNAVVEKHIRGSLKHTVGLRPRPTPGRMSPGGRISPGGRTSPPAGNTLAANSKVQAVQETEEPAEEPAIRPIVPLKVVKNSSHSSNTVAVSSPLSGVRSSPIQRLSVEDKAVPDYKEPTPPITIKYEEASPEISESQLAAGTEIPLAAAATESQLAAATESQLAAATENMNLSNEPGSRFSTTTYNTTLPDSTPGSPRRSLEIAPPLPTPPISVLNRKRPVPTIGIATITKPTPPSRKPTPSEVESGTSKSLPQSPPEANAVDRVGLLQAKLDSLNRRRGNLQTVIHELTHVVQPSSIAYDLASRQEIKKTVEGLNAESAAVAKEIHETGMKLHRAMKRRDEQSMFEPTGLWVRRVTE